MPDIYKYSLVEQSDDEEESVLIPDVWLPCDERREQQEAEERAAAAARQEEEERAQREREEAIRPTYDEEEIEARVAQRVEQLRGQLRQEVYGEVLAEKSAEVSRQLEKVDAALLQMQQEQTQFMEQFRDRLAALSLDIAEKLVLRKIEADDMFLSELVTKTVSSLKNSEWITVGVSDQLVDLVSYLRSEFKNPEYGNVEVAARYYPTDTCILETDGGVVDATISEQVANLKKEFDSIE